MNRASRHHPSRRRFLNAAGAVVSATLVSIGRPAFAHAIRRYRLPFYHTHTGERLVLDAPFDRDHRAATQRAINVFLRDFRTDEIHPIDFRLLDLLRRVRHAVGNVGTFEVISGYRSPATNAALRAKSRGVAKRSLHMQGQAIDVRLSGVDTWHVRNVALALRRGGVGYYHRSDFVHLDTGRVRSW